MYGAFLCNQEACSHLNCFCAQHKSCRDTASVTDTACRDNRNRNRIYDLRYQSHSGCLTNVSARLGSLCHNCVCAIALHSLCQSYGSHNRDYLDTGCLPHLHIFLRVSSAGGYNLYAFLHNNLCHFIGVWAHQHNIYAKRLVGCCFYLTDIVPDYLGRSICSANQAQTACCRYGCRQMALCHPCHTTLNDRALNSQEFCNSRFHLTPPDNRFQKRVQGLRLYTFLLQVIHNIANSQQVLQIIRRDLYRVLILQGHN